MEEDEFRSPARFAKNPICAPRLLLLFAGLTLSLMAMPFANSFAMTAALHRSGSLCTLCNKITDGVITEARHTSRCPERDSAFKDSFVLFQATHTGVVSAHAGELMGPKVAGSLGLVLTYVVSSFLPPGNCYLLKLTGVSQGLWGHVIVGSLSSVPHLFAHPWNAVFSSLLSGCAELSLGVWVVVLFLGRGCPSGDVFKKFMASASTFLGVAALLLGLVFAIVIPLVPFSDGSVEDVDDMSVEAAPLLGSGGRAMEGAGTEESAARTRRPWEMVLYGIVFASTSYRLAGATNWQYDIVFAGKPTEGQMLAIGGSIPVFGMLGALCVSALTARAPPLLASVVAHLVTCGVHVFGLAGGFGWQLASAAFLGLSRSMSVAAMDNFVSSSYSVTDFPRVKRIMDVTGAIAILLNLITDRMLRPTGDFALFHLLGIWLSGMGLIGLAVVGMLRRRRRKWLDGPRAI